jgi:hypothetical protein
MQQFLQQSARGAIQTGKELTRLQAGRSKGPTISDDANCGHKRSKSIFLKNQQNGLIKVQ